MKIGDGWRCWRLDEETEQRSYGHDIGARLSSREISEVQSHAGISMK